MFSEPLLKPLLRKEMRKKESLIGNLQLRRSHKASTFISGALCENIIVTKYYIVTPDFKGDLMFGNVLHEDKYGWQGSFGQSLGEYGS